MSWSCEISWKGNVGSSSCSGAMLFDAELLQLRSQRIGVKIQAHCVSLLAFDHPTAVLEHSEDMGLFNFFKRASGCELAGRGLRKESSICK